MTEIEQLLGEVSQLRWHVYGSIAVGFGAVCASYGWIIYWRLRPSVMEKQRVIGKYRFSLRLRAILRRPSNWEGEVSEADLPAFRSLRAGARRLFLILCLGQAVSVGARFYRHAILARVQRKLDRIDELAAQGPACPAPSGRGEAAR